jgi:hypothetical protein
MELPMRHFEERKEVAMNLRIRIIIVLALFVAALGGAIGISACVVVPEEAFGAAADKIEWARLDLAEQYAPELFNKAQQDYLAAKAEAGEQGRRFKLLRSYGKVKQLLASAEEAARDARKQAVAKRKEISKADSTIKLAKLELKAAMNSIKWVTGNVRESDMQSMRKTVQTLEAELEIAKRLFAEGDYEEARVKAEIALHEAYELAGVIRDVT